MSTKILLYGFGRMGLTHYSILNQLMGNADFIFIDPDWRVNYFANRNIRAQVMSSDKKLTQKFDYALICTPPLFHIPILRNCINNNITNIFVEKPFGGVSDDFSLELKSNQSISVGYVLRFNPIVNWIKENIQINKIIKVEGFYFSNTIEKKPKGWRNSSYSGVTNEVGSHIIDLCVHLFGLSNPSLLQKRVESKISDIDDILIADLEENSINFHFHFDWVNKSYRKPVFNFVITLLDETIIKFDQQKIEFYKNNFLVKKITTVDISKKVPFYLRGVEFTSQMQDFIGSKNTIATFQDSMITRSIIKQLVS